MTQETDAVAILAALNAALPAAARAYDIDDVPGTLPASYVVLYLSRRWIPEKLGSGEATVICGRLQTRYVSKTVSNVRELRRIVTNTLEDKAIGTAGPFSFETEDEIGPDDGWFSGADTFTF